MAIWNKAKLIVGGVDVSTTLRSMAYNRGAEELDDSAMGDDTRSSAGGLATWSIEGECNQTYGAPPDTAFATKVGTTVACVWRHTTTATSGAIPKYSGTGLITEYVPFSGSIGDQQICTFSIIAAGTVTRVGTPT